MIDGAVTMVLVGTAIQAVSPMRNLVVRARRRPNAAELAQSLSFTPVPSADPTLEQLMRSAGAALDART